MLSEEQKSLLSKGYKKAYLIWMIMFFSLGMYLFAGIMLKAGITKIIDREFLDNLVLIFYGLSLGQAGIALFIKRKWLKSIDVSQYNPDFDNLKKHMLSRYMQAVVISSSIASQIGLYGLILLFMGENQGGLRNFLIFAAFAMFLIMPREEDFFEFADSVFTEASQGSQ